MSGPKPTNVGWPDPTDWVNRLYEEMAQRQSVYDTETDPLLKRYKAGNMLGLVILSLLELPAFKNEPVVLPLKDLMLFLGDLDRGRDHPWSAPVNFGGTNITTTAQLELKVWVRAAFVVLRANDFKPVEAYRRIATGLTKSGRSGRNGGDVRWQLVQRWCLESETPRHHRVREKVELWWADFRIQTSAFNIDDSGGQPVPEKEIAGKFADMFWSFDHLRDRSVSGVSE